MNKKAGVGKVILIIFLALLVIVLITAYQGYRFYKVAKTEASNMQAQSEIINSSVNSGDIEKTCGALTEIETSSSKIKKEARFACFNPIIRFAVKKVMANMPINLPGKGPTIITCSSLEEIYTSSQESMKPLADICNNQTIMAAIQNQSQPPMPSQ